MKGWEVISQQSMWQNKSMSPSYELYRDAGSVMGSRGWVRGAHSRAEGVCLVGSLYVAQYHESLLSQAVIDEVHKRLMRYPSFLLFSCFGLSKHQGPIEAWNDMPWRRKSTVVRCWVI